MLTIEQLQREQAEWAQRNFGTVPAWQPLLGMVEEIGELAHAHLKEAQGIRGTAEEHQAAAKDAVGDIVIYAMDYCSREMLRMDALLTEDCAWLLHTFAELQGRRGTFGKMDAHRWIAFASECAGQEDAGGVVCAIASYCDARGWSLQEIVEETWAQVKARDWKANPATGAAL